MHHLLRARPLYCVLDASACVSLAVLISSSPVGAEPYTPRSADEVLETLPARPAYPRIAEITALERRFAADPANEALGTELVLMCITRAKTLSQEKYLAAADAAVTTMLAHDSHSAEALRLRDEITVWRSKLSRTNGLTRISP